MTRAGEDNNERPLMSRKKNDRRCPPSIMRRKKLDPQPRKCSKRSVAKPITLRKRAAFDACFAASFTKEFAPGFVKHGLKSVKHGLTQGSKAGTAPGEKAAQD
jgi:hypothetical protein